MKEETDDLIFKPSSSVLKNENSAVDLFRKTFEESLSDFVNKHELSEKPFQELRKLKDYSYYKIKEKVQVEGIRFPKMHKDDYEVWKYFTEVVFVNCVFSGCDFLEIFYSDCYINFKNCKFKDSIKFNKFDKFKKRYNNPFFNECEFCGDVYFCCFKEFLKDYYYCIFFEKCEFSQYFFLEDSYISKDLCFDLQKCESGAYSLMNLFKECELSCIELISIEFENKVKFNEIEINFLIIKDCYFRGKLEIKKSKIYSFEFINSNVSRVFDAFESEFCKFNMKKSIFSDFAGFERVCFGSEESQGSERNKSLFTYVTFMSFSNFRKTTFHSGLDLSNANLKEPPNFFNATGICWTNTDRETLRIIKNSFDKAGNYIEANGYFIEEMKAYKRELKNTDKEYSTKIIIYMNDIISSFGQSYLKPICWLVISIFLYTCIIYLQTLYFISENSKFYFFIDFLNTLSGNFLPFSRFFENKNGLEFISLLFYVWFLILIWQIIIAVKRHTIR